MEKKYSNLVKPLRPKQAPDGMYPFPLYWMEGSDLEGFGAHYGFCVVKEEGVFHPNSGSVVHPYDEVLLFGGLSVDNPDYKVYLGAEPRDFFYLGGEVSIIIGTGAEREEYIFNEPTAICIPKGTPHGPITVRRVTEPFGHSVIGLSPESRAIISPEDETTRKSLDTKYAHLVKQMKTYVDQELIDTGLDYHLCCDERGIMKSDLAPHGMLGPGNTTELFWMFGKDLERFDVNFTWGYADKAGIWHRIGYSHRHPEEEILVFQGIDPGNPDELGAEIEIALGDEDERHIFSEPTAVVCPKGFPHLPQITRWVDKKYGFFVICLSGEHASPWSD